jgi:hypothetical protein
MSRCSSFQLPTPKLRKGFTKSTLSRVNRNEWEREMGNLVSHLLLLFSKLRRSFYSFGFEEESNISPVTPLEKHSLLLVFDIDDTLVTESYQEPADIQLKFKLSENSNELTLNILPGMIELLQYVLQEQKLRIAFFSSAPAIRNEVLIPIILRKAFPHHHEEMLANSAIFSRYHIREREKKDLKVVVEHYEQKFHEKIALENIILIDDSRLSNVAGQNFIDVPKRFELGKDRLYYLAGLLNEMLNSNSPPSVFLANFQKNIFGDLCCKPFTVPLVRSGLKILQRINPALELLDESLYLGLYEWSLGFRK